MEHRGFKGSENTLNDTIRMDTGHHTFVQTHKIYDAKSEPQSKQTMDFG